VEELRVDCDADVVLARVHQEGAACHTGARTCFYRGLDQSVPR
jgi:phosphoribosyl-AMP cyclohydrolase